MPETLFDKIRRWLPWNVAGRWKLLILRWWRQRACREFGGCLPNRGDVLQGRGAPNPRNTHYAVCQRCHYVMGDFVAWVDTDGDRRFGIHLGKGRVRLGGGEVVLVPSGIALIPMEAVEEE